MYARINSYVRLERRIFIKIPSRSFMFIPLRFILLFRAYFFFTRLQSAKKWY